MDILVKGDKSQKQQRRIIEHLSDQDGRMHYAKTLDEHNENIRKYLSN